MVGSEPNSPGHFGFETQQQKWWVRVWATHRMFILVLLGCSACFAVFWGMRYEQAPQGTDIGSTTPALHALPSTHESRAAAEQERDQRVRELGATLELGALNAASGSEDTTTLAPAGPAPVLVP